MKENMFATRATRVAMQSRKKSLTSSSKQPPRVPALALRNNLRSSQRLYSLLREDH